MNKYNFRISELYSVFAETPITVTAPNKEAAIEIAKCFVDRLRYNNLSKKEKDIVFNSVSCDWGDQEMDSDSYNVLDDESYIGFNPYIELIDEDTEKQVFAKYSCEKPFTIIINNPENFPSLVDNFCTIEEKFPELLEVIMRQPDDN